MKKATSKNYANHVFIDVDGVLLDFESIFLPVFHKNGITPPSEAQMANRHADYISEAFPHIIGSQRERELVAEVFRSGALKTQSMYNFLCKKTLNNILASENVYILTKLDPDYINDRVDCFKKMHNIDIKHKILTVWNEMTKGEKMVSFCKENGLCHKSSILIDDRHDNIESALVVGSLGLLVERSYNTQHRNRLKEVYDDRFQTVGHENLTTVMQDLAFGRMLLAEAV